MGGVFVNYRTRDGDWAADLLARALSERFGVSNVFFDNRSIPVGSDFPDQILRRLRDSDVLLVVVGPRWLTIEDEACAARKVIAAGRARHHRLGTMAR
ncbi:toll/interleukin-1 receptor domain-containing protein [Saccharothrix sp. NRRL B-16314]|uniref:toll/interleukin-1 receptor domain-containing protein n=1 Tax=Saccharothrix sp. NRRL B-16314 TaxID=1463825 RepID=UPI0009DD2072|nr:toll/interleukin-1 receptor domain-containing protein [Saccharothrix sp. NRRL B-16314]